MQRTLLCLRNCIQLSSFDVPFLSISAVFVAGAPKSFKLLEFLAHSVHQVCVQPKWSVERDSSQQGLESGKRTVSTLSVSQTVQTGQVGYIVTHLHIKRQMPCAYQKQ